MYRNSSDHLACLSCRLLISRFNTACYSLASCKYYPRTIQALQAPLSGLKVTTLKPVLIALVEACQLNLRHSLGLARFARLTQLLPPGHVPPHALQGCWCQKCGFLGVQCAAPKSKMRSKMVRSAQSSCCTPTEPSRLRSRSVKIDCLFLICTACETLPLTPAIRRGCRDRLQRLQPAIASFVYKQICLIHCSCLSRQPAHPEIIAWIMASSLLMHMHKALHKNDVMPALSATVLAVGSAQDL